MVAKKELPAGNVAQGTALKETQGSMGFGAFLVSGSGNKTLEKKKPSCERVF